MPADRSETSTPDPLSVKLLAHHAFAEARRRQDEERQAAQQRRAAEEAAKDAETMEWVREHPWLVRYLSGVEWKLIDRVFPQATAVISPVSEPDVQLIVSRDSPSYISLAVEEPAMTVDPRRKWLVGSYHCATLAELGHHLDDRKRARAHLRADEELIQP